MDRVTSRHGSIAGRLIVAAVVAGWWAGSVRPVGAASFIGIGGDPAGDILNKPDRIYSFDGPVITWKMDGGFIQKYASPLFHEQVRLAINEWERASFSAIKRHPQAAYGWTRRNGDKDFYDLRSVLTHEIGHALGSQHPDAAWFNNNYQLNFVKDNGGYVPQGPLGGEIMNEGNSPGFLPGTKPPRGLGGGEYWRIVSKDELLFMDYAYGQPVDFVEVGPNDPADLTIGLFNIGGSPGSTLGSAGPDTYQDRDLNDLDAGRRILTASARINAVTSQPISFIALPRNWEFDNQTGEPVDGLVLRTRGTDNPNPTSWTSQGAHRFQQRGTLAPPPIPSPDAFMLEDVWHFYHDPAAGPLAHGQAVEVGLRQDVWDWSVVSAHAVQVDNDFVPVSLLSAQEWYVTGPVIPDAGPPPPDDIHVGGLWELQASMDTLIQGIELLNNQLTVTQVTDLALAPAPHLPPRPDLLDSDTKDQLARDGLLIDIPLASPLTLSPGQSFFFILEGRVDDLPRDIQQAGNYMMLSLPPGLMDQPLFVYAASTGDAGDVGNYALLNTGPFVPEPATVGLLLILLGGAGRRRVGSGGKASA